MVANFYESDFDKNLQKKKSIKIPSEELSPRYWASSCESGNSCLANKELQNLKSGKLH